MNQRAQTLNRLRRQIDRIDQSLLRLLNRRATLAVRIGNLKRKQGLPVFDSRREKQVLGRLKRTNGGPLPAGSIRRIFHQILACNRKLES